MSADLGMGSMRVRHFSDYDDNPHAESVTLGVCHPDGARDKCEERMAMWRFKHERAIVPDEIKKKFIYQYREFITELNPIESEILDRRNSELENWRKKNLKDKIQRNLKAIRNARKRLIKEEIKVDKRFKNPPQTAPEDLRQHCATYENAPIYHRPQQWIAQSSVAIQIANGLPKKGYKRIGVGHWENGFREVRFFRCLRDSSKMWIATKKIYANPTT